MRKKKKKKKVRKDTCGFARADSSLLWYNGANTFSVLRLFV